MDIFDLEKYISTIQPPSHPVLFIHDVKLISKELELTVPFETSFGRETSELRLYPVITFVTESGEKFKGVGEATTENMAWYNGEYRKGVVTVLEDQLIPTLLKNKTTPIHTILDFKGMYSWVVGHNLAKCGIEGAYWDAIGMVLNKPAWKLFGGTRKVVETGTSVGLEKDIHSIVQKVESAINLGAKRIKLKIKPGMDINVVEAVRKKYPDIPLMVDANAAYNLFDSKHIDILNALDSYNLMMIEQPGSNEDIYFHSLASKHIQTPICLDESIHTIEDALAAIDIWKKAEILDRIIINIKPPRVGGYWESILMAKACHKMNIDTWCGGMLESSLGKISNIHFSSLKEVTIPGDHISQKPYYTNDVTVPPLFENGLFVLNNKPGWGVDLAFVD